MSAVLFFKESLILYGPYTRLTLASHLHLKRMTWIHGIKVRAGVVPFKPTIKACVETGESADTTPYTIDVVWFLHER